MKNCGMGNLRLISVMHAPWRTDALNRFMVYMSCPVCL